MSSGWWVSEHLDNRTHKVQNLNTTMYSSRELYIWHNIHILKEQDLTSFPCGRGWGILYQVDHLTIHHPWGRARHSGGYPTIMNLLIHTHHKNMLTVITNRGVPGGGPLTIISQLLVPLQYFTLEYQPLLVQRYTLERFRSGCHPLFLSSCTWSREMAYTVCSCTALAVKLPETSIRYKLFLTFTPPPPNFLSTERCLPATMLGGSYWTEHSLWLHSLTM